MNEFENIVSSKEIIEKFEKNKKYQKLLETAQLLFIKYGIKKISVEEICSKANVSKMTYYKFFKHKNDIVKHIIKKSFDENHIKHLDIMNESISFIDKLKKILSLKLKNINEFGDSFFSDLISNNELIEILNELKKENNTISIEFLKKGQEEGVFRKSITPEIFIYFQNIILNMYKDQEFINLVNEPQKRFQEIMNFIFYGLKDPEFKE